MNEMAVKQFLLRPSSFYGEIRIDQMLGQGTTEIQLANHRVVLGEKSLTYDLLALTTGASLPRFPASVGGDLGHVYTMRRIADVDRMAPDFQIGRRVLVIGGGYIGPEAAVVTAELDLRVTVVETASRILQRVAAPETSNFFRDLPTTNSVEMLEGVALDRLQVGDLIIARFADSTTTMADFVIVGVGIRPNDDLATAAGLVCDDGVLVDANGRTCDPDIWATAPVCHIATSRSVRKACRPISPK